MKKAFPLLLILLIAGSAYAQPPQEYYVVIGAFRIQNNAVRFTDQANKAGFTAEYAINSRNNLYYVFLLATTEKRKAFSFMVKMRAETIYKDAWVYTGSLGAGVSEPVDPPKDEPIDETPVEPKDEPKPEEPKPEEIQPEEPKPEEVKPKFRPYVFKLVDDTNAEVKGEVFVQEDLNSEDFTSVPGNEKVYIEPPKNSLSTYVVTTMVPGYRVASQTINFRQTQATSADINFPITITLAVKKVKTGDYIEFSRVRFFRDAVLMQPGSKDELDGLVDLMKENPKYRIRIHAHCNGKKSREVTTLGSSTDLFAPAAGNEKKTLSAKKLTTERAELVKRYLVSQGIEGKRIATKGEGGVIPLYPENSSNGVLNDRVEIEITRR